MSALRIRNALETIVKPIVDSKTNAANEFASGNFQDVNDKSRWKYPLVYLISEIPIAYVGSPQQKLVEYSVQLMLMDKPPAKTPDRDGQQAWLFQCWDKLEQVLWSAIWDALNKLHKPTWGIWVPAATLPKLTPLEYENQDGVSGYLVEFVMQGYTGSRCDYQQLTNVPVNCLKCAPVPMPFLTPDDAC